MDKKAKKQITVLRERIQKLKKMLSSIKQQCDDPSEIKELEDQIAKAERELAALVET